MRLNTPSQEITLYLQSDPGIGSYNLQLNKLSLTGGASWIRNPTVAVNNANQGEIHSFANKHTKKLEQGHAFWLSTIGDINPENRTVVNEALTEKLNTLNSILESGINQGSMASIEAPLSKLEESLKNSPNHVKIGLLNKIQTQIKKEINSNHQAHLIQQKALLETIIQDRSPTADSAQEQASQKTINEAYSTLKNLFNRRKCIHLLKDTLPVMLEHGTESFTDLLGYCTLCLEESKGEYSDPEKIDTLIGLLVECALAYRDGASCTAGIRERCQRDGYFIKNSLGPTPASTSNTVYLLRQIREHYTENKLMATSDEPSPLLGLLIMDTILKKHGITTWSVCGEEENRSKLENLSPTSWQALQDYLGTEKAKLTAELTELNEIKSMNQEDKASQNTTLALTEKLAKEQSPINIASIQLMLVNSPGVKIENEKESFIENIQTLKNRNTTLSYTLLSTPGDAVEECYELLICHGQWDSEKIFIRPRRAASTIGSTCSAVITGITLGIVAPVGWGVVGFTSGFFLTFGVSAIAKVDAHSFESFLVKNDNHPAIRCGESLRENIFADTTKWVSELGYWDNTITMYDSTISRAACHSYLHHVINFRRASTLSVQEPPAQNVETNNPLAISLMTTPPVRPGEFPQNVQLCNNNDLEDGHNQQEDDQQAEPAEPALNEAQPASSSCVIA
jgi:hypothetical protein